MTRLNLIVKFIGWGVNRILNETDSPDCSTLLREAPLIIKKFKSCEKIFLKFKIKFHNSEICARGDDSSIGAGVVNIFILFKQVF